MRTSACPVGEIFIFGGAMSDDGQQRFGDEALQELFAEFRGQLVSPGGAAALLGVKRETIHTLGKRGRERLVPMISVKATTGIEPV
ncbi:MAG: hypothetical protein WBV77_16940 [Solirubrobacteraceae bacterium]